MHMHIGAQRGGGGVGAAARVLCMSAVPDKVSIMRRPTASTCHTNQIKQKKPSRSCRQLAASSRQQQQRVALTCRVVASTWPNSTKPNTRQHHSPSPSPPTYSYFLTLFSTRTCRTNVHNYVHLASCRAATATKWFFSFIFFLFPTAATPAASVLTPKTAAEQRKRRGQEGAYVDFEMHWEWMPAKKENRNMKDIIANILGHLTYCGKAALSLI